MCNVNNDPKRLANLRAKGHVLVKGYKEVYQKCREVRSYWYHSFVWKKGWNYARARDYCNSGRKITRTKPFKYDAYVNESIHVFKTRTGLYNGNIYDTVILPVWYYADEVTSYQSYPDRGHSGHIITVSKVLVKQLPKTNK